jgi:pimeloyl-ACP methyl ester carboxylesterase
MRKIFFALIISLSTILMKAQCTTGTLELQLDNYPGETSWRVKNTSGAILFNGSGYGGQTNQLINIPICLGTNQNYTFEINDSYGDGICCTYGQGFYKLKDNVGNVIIQGGSFTHSDIKPFCYMCNTPPAPTCTDGIMNGSETGIDCGGSCPACATNTQCVNVTIEIKTDNYPSETSWNITNPSGLVVFSGGSYNSANQVISIPVCLNQNINYTFRISDAYGDGICCNYGQGYYKILLNGTILAQGGQFSSFETKPICISCGTSSPPSSGERNIVFVHGLGGSVNSWDRMQSIHAQIFPAQGNSSCPSSVWQSRNTDATTFGYTQNSIDGAANSIRTQANSFFSTKRNQIFNTEKDFLIAHSQGGVVARYLDKQIDDQGVPRSFGGLITVGSPHGGAKIVNNIANGTVDQFFNYACNIFGNQTISDLPGIFSFFGLNKTLLNIKTQLCDVISPQVLPTFGKDLLQPVRAFYMDGSTELASLNQYSHPNIAKIAAYGIEDNPIMWRTITSFNTNINALPCFGGDNDTELVDQVSSNIIKTQERINIMEFELALCNPIHNLTCYLFNRGTIKNRIAATKEVKRFWETASMEWEVLIGARTYFHTPTFQNQCLIKSYNYGDLIQEYTTSANSPAECANYQYNSGSSWTDAEPVYSYSYSSTVVPSDGVAISSSQQAFPGAITTLMQGSNHQQMRNDSRLKVVLNLAYNGQLHPYFLTDPK